MKQEKNCLLGFFFPFYFAMGTQNTGSDCDGRWRSPCRLLKVSCVFLPLEGEGSYAEREEI